MRRRLPSFDPSSKRFVLVAAAALAALAACPGGCAKAAKNYRIGVLVGTASMSGLYDGFKRKMAELGYAEGKNVAYDAESSNADRAEERRIAEKFIADKVDLVFVFPGQPVMAVKTAAKGTKIPIVFANAIVGGTDLVDSVRSPGGNITGVRVPSPELSLKSLESLLELKPTTRRVMILYDPGYPTDGPILESLRAAAAASGVALREVPVADPSKIAAVLAGLEKDGDADMDAVIFLPDTITRSTEASKEVLAFADRHRVPLIGGTPAMAEGGITLTAAADPVEPGELAAVLADKILEGAPAGSIPVVTTKTYLVVNYKKARELGLSPPEGLLKQAGKIIR
jgi:putative tryptophan/tyrosine transport system substrate-binding protein